MNVYRRKRENTAYRRGYADGSVRSSYFEKQLETEKEKYND